MDWNSGQMIFFLNLEFQFRYDNFSVSDMIEINLIIIGVTFLLLCVVINAFGFKRLVSFSIVNVQSAS